MAQQPVLMNLGTGLGRSQNQFAVFHMQHADVRAGLAFAKQLLHTAHVIVELIKIAVTGLTQAEYIVAGIAAEARPVDLYALRRPLRGPDMPVDAAYTGGIQHVGFLHPGLIIVHVAVAAVSGGFGRQHLVLQVRAAGEQTVHIDLVCLVQVFQLGIIHRQGRLGDLQILAVGNLRTQGDAIFMQPIPEGDHQVFHIQFGEHIMIIVQDTLAKVRVRQVIGSVYRRTYIDALGLR